MHVLLTSAIILPIAFIQIFRMLMKSCFVYVASFVVATEALRVVPRTVDDYIDDIRRDSHVPIYHPPVITGREIPAASLVEVGNGKRPLSVAEFREWVRNLYYDEEKKRESTIKYMLENEFPREAVKVEAHFP